ncbi:hypothetical protein WN944_018535 [Citrus x changshan-huyou]|uniref:Protein kinase domain-containing protein n=1 Tax=Citrus x changshan-huyou TaxID=2935761 RepID=A0AAP0QFJ0_9ROSI
MKHRLKVVMEIANAVAYLHVGFSRPIVFRDIKPSTVLFQERNVAKFFNFSLSISIPEGKTHVNDNDKLIGTFGFIAPECMTTGNCDEKSDELVKKSIESKSFKEIVHPAIVGEEGLWPEKEKQLRSHTELAIKCLF